MLKNILTAIHLRRCLQVNLKALACRSKLYLCITFTNNYTAKEVHENPFFSAFVLEREVEAEDDPFAFSHGIQIESVCLKGFPVR